MSVRRPWRSAGHEVIGWWECCTLLPTVVRRLGGQVRVLSCYLPRRPDTTPMPPLAPTPTGTAWIVAAEKAVGTSGPAEMSDVWRRHSVRTWRFAAALAADADAELTELLYVAALLHDSGLFLERDAGESFAAAGARLVRRTAEVAGVDDTRAELVATAVESHISMKPGDLLGQCIQFGSLLDLTAAGIWRLDRGFVEQVYASESRRGLPSDAHDRWLAECQRLPFGRAAFARCPGGLLLATRLAPLPHSGT